MKEHHIKVSRTARYFTVGGDAPVLERVWFVCHGYGQLAADFVRYCSVLDDGHTLVVAPEGLSRFYLDRVMGIHDRGAPIGASWMTRHDRLNEIDDYTAYLDALYVRILDEIEEPVAVRVLGFSQGAATASRWIAQGRATVDRLVLWGGLPPPDVDLFRNTERFSGIRVTLVVGDSDPIVDANEVAAFEERLRSHGVECDTIRFVGSHQLNQHVLRRISASDQSD